MKTKWKIGYKRRGKNLFDLSGLKIWETPEGQYEADPFLYKHKGTNYLFYELYDYKMGVIAYSTITKDGISEPTVCLEERKHLSYPHVFSDQGEIYMIPESGQLKKVVIYRAIEFPDKWEPVKTIIDNAWVEDNNIFFHNGSWWLLTSRGGSALLIMRAKHLLGDWKQYDIVEEQDCRSAGRVFEMDGKLIRPCQDTQESYGRSVILKEITLPDYTAEAFDRIEPELEAAGLHTFNYNEDFCVVDLKYFI